MLVAHLFLAIGAVAARALPAVAGLIPLTLNEFRHLFAALVIAPTQPVRHVGLESPVRVTRTGQRRMSMFSRFRMSRETSKEWLRYLSERRVEPNGKTPMCGLT